MRIKTQEMLGHSRPLRGFPYGKPLTPEQVLKLKDVGVLQLGMGNGNYYTITSSSVMVDNNSSTCCGSSEIDKTCTCNNFKTPHSSRVFDTGSVRDSDEGKPRTSDFTPYALLRYGYHMAKNAKKYGRGNWELGQPDESTIESLDRHWQQYRSGNRDEDHLASMLFGIVMLMQNEDRDGIEANKYFNK